MDTTYIKISDNVIRKTETINTDIDCFSLEIIRANIQSEIDNTDAILAEIVKIKKEAI